MSTIILSIIFSLVAICFLLSLIVTIRESKWKADIQTYNGKQKLAKLQYERLELVRYRKKNNGRGSVSEKYLKEVPLTDPMPQGRVRNENWESINKISKLNFSRVFSADTPYDLLRLYGWKDGVRHTVFDYAFYPENYEDLQALVNSFNEKKLLP
ncbi:MAG: hypothetical protein IKI31_03955 [Treponema sp.]|nr:hypothetical protein [Treponema sp.]